MSLTDPRFAGNTAGTSGIFISAGTLDNETWNENPTYPNGDQCWTWSSASASDVLNVSQCAVDWREGPRVAATVAGAQMNVDQCFINCVGMTGDHADGIQAFAGTGARGIVTVTNTCFRSYTDTEAANVYGAGFIGSDAFFWADSAVGTVNFSNVLIWGGSRGVTIDADTSVTNVSFNNVYFVPSPDGWTDYSVLVQNTGGAFNIVQWTNVFNATIVGGVIVPGSAIAAP